MIFGLDLGMLALVIAGLLVFLLAIDLLTTGGSTCASMAGSMAGAMGTPWAGVPCCWRWWWACSCGSPAVGEDDAA